MHENRIVPPHLTQMGFLGRGFGGMGAIEDMRVSKTRPPRLLAGPFKRVCLHYRQKVHETGGRLSRAVATIGGTHQPANPGLTNGLPGLMAGPSETLPARSFASWLTGTDQQVPAGSCPHRGLAWSVLLMVIGNAAHNRLQSPSPSRSARSSCSLRWRHLLLSRHASGGFLDGPTN